MNRDDIIRTAREAGFKKAGDAYCGLAHELERFATLVAAAERHECAKIVDGNADACDGLMEQVLRSNAAAIRARGQA